MTQGVHSVGFVYFYCQFKQKLPRQFLWNPVERWSLGGKKMLMNFFTHWSLWRTVYHSFFPVINIEYFWPIYNQQWLEQLQNARSKQIPNDFFFCVQHQRVPKKENIFLLVYHKPRGLPGLSWLKIDYMQLETMYISFKNKKEQGSSTCSTEIHQLVCSNWGFNDTWMSNLLLIPRKILVLQGRREN